MYLCTHFIKQSWGNSWEMISNGIFFNFSFKKKLFWSLSNHSQILIISVRTLYPLEQTNCKQSESLFYKILHEDANDFFLSKSTNSLSHRLWGLLKPPKGMHTIYSQPFYLAFILVVRNGTTNLTSSSLENIMEVVNFVNCVWVFNFYLY